MFSTFFKLFLLLVVVAVVTRSMEGFDSETKNNASYDWMNAPPVLAASAEGFAPTQASESLLPEHTPLLDFVPDGPSPTDLYTKQSYLLLEDVMPAATVKNPVVTAKACYDANFANEISKLGSYRQLTNNYKREYPDNCSALNKDVEMGFY